VVRGVREELLAARGPGRPAAALPAVQGEASEGAEEGGVMGTEIARRWFIFGESADRVDIADTEGDVICGVPRADAERLIATHDAICDLAEDLERLTASRGTATWPLILKYREKLAAIRKVA